MFTIAFWSVAAFLSLSVLGVLARLLWLQLKNLFSQFGRSQQSITSRLSQAPTEQDLRELGVLSTPRDVKLDMGATERMELNTQRQLNLMARKRRRAQIRKAAQTRWRKIYS